MTSIEGNDFCSLVKEVLDSGSKGEFLSNIKELCSSLRSACRVFSAAESLFGGGDVSVNELPDDLQRVVNGVAKGVPPVGGKEWLVRTFLGVRVPAAGGGELVVRSGGVGEWVCRVFVRGVEDVAGNLRCLESVEGRADALITLSRSVGGSGVAGLKVALAKVSESLLNLLPGISRYVTLAWLLRFTSVSSLREGLRGCGLHDLNAVESLLREFSPAIFDLGRCRLYRGVDDVPRGLLSRSDYLLTSGTVTVRREGWEGRSYVIYGEEIPSSPIYGFLNSVTEGWVRAEEILFGTSPTLKALEAFIDANLRNTELRLTARGRRVIDAILEGNEFKVVTLPGKDEFSADDKALVLELTQAVACGIMNACVGWDGVKRGNAVINRYAVRFKPTYVLKASKHVQELVTSKLLRT